MTDDFDWQTEEDSQWENTPAPPPPPKPTPRRGRRVLLGLIVLGLAVTAVTLIYRQLTRRVETVSSGLEAEVLDTYQLVQKASQAQDVDLFVSLLSGRSESWGNAQQEALLSGGLLGRDGLGLAWQTELNENAPVTVTLAADLRQAEVTTDWVYAFPIGNGRSDMVTLRQTAVYRPGPTRWLLAPPNDDYWGETLTSRGHFLKISYPARDQQLGERLAVDLEKKILDACTNLRLECPPTLQVVVQLSSDPASLSRIQSQHPAFTEVNNIVLPTPTLVGLPIDEAGYEALFRGYGTQVVTAVILQQVPLACCDGVLFYQAALAEQLRQLSLRPWPLALAHYKALQSGGQGLEVAETYWSVPNWSTDEASLTAVYAVVEFLVLHQITPTELQRSLAASQGQSYGTWMTGFVPAESDPNAAWQAFLAIRASK